MIFVFFFQAEDGIRDLVRSRGLGDVYKRQEEEFFVVVNAACKELDLAHLRGGLPGQEVTELEAVSYTHLTLPTSDLV
mgnify:CR=1 FL=1